MSGFGDLNEFMDNVMKQAGHRECKHGQLARVCNICELEEEVKELQTGNQELQKALENQGPGKVIAVPEWADMLKQLSEIEAQINGLNKMVKQFKRQLIRNAQQSRRWKCSQEAITSE